MTYGVVYNSDKTRLIFCFKKKDNFVVPASVRIIESQAFCNQMSLKSVTLPEDQDDHNKNISFLMGADGRWRLSPAYDMGFAYNPSGSWTRTHQMSINGKYDDLTRKDLLACAAANNIKNASEIIDQVCDEAAKWPSSAKECGVPQSMIDAIVPHLLLTL